MRQLIFIVMLLLVIDVGPASAQFFFPSSGIGFAHRGGIGFGYRGGRFGIVGGLGYSSYYRYGGFPFFPGGYYGYTSFAPVYPPTIIVAPTVVIRPPSEREPRGEAVADPEPPPVDPKRFIVIRPDRPTKDFAPERLDPPIRKEVVRIPGPKLPVVNNRPVKSVDLGIKPRELPLASAPEVNPRAEADRQIELGRAAFAGGELGRALERFKQAVSAAPLESSAYFLLAQAQYALGKYPDAVETLEAGLKLRPDWPQTRFRSRELYGLNGAVFDDHLRQLRTALEAIPEDPKLLFLLGVELWFDGKREEAVRLMEQAAKRMPKTAAVERFIELKS